MKCLNTPYKQLYEQFIESCFFGNSGCCFLQPEDPSERAKCITTGFAVNKEMDGVLTCTFPKYSFQYQVFDHIRVVEEVLSGMFVTDNKEFNHVFPIFMREFMLGSIYVLYSPEFRDYELTLAAKLAEENQEDPFERLEKSYPDSAFRLLRRVAHEKEGWRWDAILSGVQDIKIEEFLPIVDGNPKHPLRFSFNEGFLFVRLYQIFAQYEAQSQTHKNLFNALHKVGDITGEDFKSIQSKEIQFYSAGVFTHTAMAENSATITVEDLKLVERLPQLHDSYDIVQATLNDALGRLGLAGDDSTKAERVTTGENFRALQPNMSFQQAIQNRLDNATERFKIHFGQTVTFTNNIQPNEQGIPITGDPKENPKDKPKKPSQKDAGDKS